MGEHKLDILGRWRDAIVEDESKSAFLQIEPVNDSCQPSESIQPLFPSRARHELMTPVTSIRAFAEILMNNPDMEMAQRQHFLNIVLQESKRLTECIDSLLEQPNETVDNHHCAPA